MADIDLTPVRDNHIPSKRPRTTNGYNDTGGHKREAQDRRMISHWTRDDLEDRYLRLHDDNIVLKQHARKQEEHIKRMATKIRRLTNDRKKNGEVGLGDASLGDVDMQKRILDLEKINRDLKEKVHFYKNQANAQTKTTTHYDYVQPRVQTGVKSEPPAAEAHLRSSRRVLGPRDSAPISGHPQGHMMRSGGVEGKRLEQVIVQLNEQINHQEQTIDELRDQLRVKQSEFEEDLYKVKRQSNVDQRQSVQENVDLIRLQREVKEKATQLTAVHSKYQTIEGKMAVVEESNNQLMRELERVNRQLKMKEDHNLRLDTESKQMNSLRKQMSELQHDIEDLKRENIVLKEANDKLTGSAFDTERERQWRAKEVHYRTQIQQLEATLRRDCGEKGDVLGRLESERDKAEVTEKELSELRIRHYEMQQKYDELSDKMRFFTKESTVDTTEIEEALLLVKQRREQGSQQLDFIQRVDMDKDKDVQRRLHEMEASHAETIQELEKTRNMLIVQYKINNDYKSEADTITSRMDELKADYEAKLTEYAKLLDIRAARIRKLEHQLKDIAYGTKQFQTTKGLESMPPPTEAEEEIDEAVCLQRGENLLEIHVGKLVMNEDTAEILGDHDPLTFATWDFYEFETQLTGVMRGLRPDFDLTAEYPVQVDDFFLHYLQKESTTLELHQAVGSEYRTLAACQLQCRTVLDTQKSGTRVHLTAQLIGVLPGAEGRDIGMLEYWVRLRVPMDQALRLYRERTKALGYITTNTRAQSEAIRALDENADQRPPDNMNELHVKVLRCQGLRARRNDLQPSPYFAYRFFDFPDHDSAIIPSSNNPEFHDHKIFPLTMTPDVDKFLKTQPLKVYVFDDTDPEKTAYLGVANVALIPLVHNKPVVGVFQLAAPDGGSNGSIEVEIRWQFAYQPVGYSGVSRVQAAAVSRDRVPVVSRDEAGSSHVYESERTETHTTTTTTQERVVHKVASRGHVEQPKMPSPVEQPKMPSPVEQPSPRDSPPTILKKSRPGPSPPSILKKDRPTPQPGSFAEEEIIPTDKTRAQSSPGMQVKRRDGKSEETRKAALEELIRLTPPLDVKLEPTVSSSKAALAAHGRSAAAVSEESIVATKSLRKSRESEDLDTSLKRLEESSSAPHTLVSEGTPVTGESQTVSSGSTLQDETSGASDITPRPTSVKHDRPIAPPRKHLTPGRSASPSRRDSGQSSDSEGVVISASFDSAGVRTSRTLTTPGENTDSVVVEVAEVLLEDDCPLFRDSSIKMLFVEYAFLGLPNGETETPFALPKPKVTDKNKKMTFNFRKVFHIDFNNNYARRQHLASMLLAGDPLDGCITFLVVNEPPDDESGECDEVGFARVSVREIYHHGHDIDNKMVPIYSTAKNKQVIGQLTVTVKCLAALKAIVEEMPGIQLAV